jgi:hypothetical protein
MYSGEKMAYSSRVIGHCSVSAVSERTKMSNDPTMHNNCEVCVVTIWVLRGTGKLLNLPLTWFLPEPDVSLQK